MSDCETTRRHLGAAMGDADGDLSRADRLCRACVELLAVDGAAISLLKVGELQGTLGSSGALSRRLDEFQFTFGEGPGLDAVRLGRPVHAADLQDPGERRWPAFTDAALDAGVRAVFALPVRLAGASAGALDLICLQPGTLIGDRLNGGLWAAELAALPLSDLMTAAVDWAAGGGDGDGWTQLASLERVEVYQATGMLIAQLDVDAVEALVRLRAHAYAAGLTASEVAWAIVERRLRLDADDSWRRSGGRTEDR